LRYKPISIFVKAGDQPGRFVAVFVVSPVLARKGIEYDDFFIKSFSVALFLWDGFWILFKKPVRFI
jgi:hypothetical protein